MGEVQEQRYVCKICSKNCVSGRSLGGHMRVHLAEISASKKAAKAKAEIKMDCEGGDDQEDGSYQLKESPKDQSNSAFRNEEKIKNYDSNTDSEDADDHNNYYELRENPKKSWRFSDPKHGPNISKNGASCKECGKEFSTLRALSGHMRTHSIKNKKKTHQCKKCGKGFDSMRAMFGHMKSHSKRSRVPDDSADSLSDLENLCPVRKKRSVIRYQSALNPSLSNLNESNCAVFELEEVAKILIMLSRGVRDWSKFDSVVEYSDDDDSVYFGADSFGKSKNFLENDGDFVCDVDKNKNAFKDKNVSEFDGLDSSFVAKDEMEVGFGVADGEKLLSAENETDVDLEVSDVRVCKVVEPEKLNEFAVKVYCTSELGKDFLAANATNEAILEFVKSNKVSSSVQESGSETNSSENEANLDILKGFEKKQEFKFKNCDKSKEHECPICFKVFSSGQALGGHKRAHYNTGFTTESKNQEVIMPAVNQELAVVEVNNDLFDLNLPVTVVEGTKRDVGHNLWWVERGHEHEALSAH